MKTHVLAALAASLVAGAASGQATLYSQDRFHGRSFVVNQTVHNLDGAGFNDRASSIIVERGSWEVCDDSEFRGRCIVLRPGQYPSLAAMGLDNRVSSVRRVGGGGHYTFAPPPQAPAPYPYYQRNGERLFQANVVAVRAVTGPPEQRCWMEPQQVTAPSQPNIPGAILGGVLGGVLGHQVGSGDAKLQRVRAIKHLRRKHVGGLVDIDGADDEEIAWHWKAPPIWVRDSPLSFVESQVGDHVVVRLHS